MLGGSWLHFISRMTGSGTWLAFEGLRLAGVELQRLGRYDAKESLMWQAKPRMSLSAFRPRRRVSI